MNETRFQESVANATVLSKGKWHAKLISADKWGSSGFYPADVLQRDGSRVFHKGIQMFQNHMSESQRFERPEGSVENLVGKLISDAVYEPDGDDGPGLYADVQFYPSYIDRIAELHEDVGLSINADGLTEYGERDGREGPVVAAMLKADSVDVVTKAGAGGKLTRILESDRGLAGRPIQSKEHQSMTDLTKEDLDASITALSTSLTAEIGKLPGLFAEAIKATTAPVTPAAEGESHESTNTASTTDTTTATATQVPEIDHVAIVEALRTSALPAQVSAAVIASVKGGKTVDEAVAEQVALREAFVHNAAETGIVTLRESQGGAKPTGLARSVQVLKG